MIKAIFFDVDGTLVSFRTHKVSPGTVRALHKLREKGMKLFVATGRHPAMLSYVSGVFPFDGWVYLSGQYCRAGDRVLHRNPMDRAAVEELVAAAGTGTFSCMFLEGEDIYLNRVDGYVRRFMADLDLPIPPVADPKRALEGEIYQAIAFLDREREHLLLDAAPHLKVTRWHPHFLDVIPATGGKDVGMEAVLAHFGLKAEQAMAFGDGENDLTMLLRAGIGVAMGSASDYVKARADYTTGTVDEEGIVTALEHFGLL